MQKTKRAIALSMAVILFLLTVLAAHVFAADIYDGYHYETDEYGFAILVGWDNSSDTLYVPSNIGRYAVAEIGNSAFYGDDYIKRLDMSGAVNLDAIGMYAFANSALVGQVIIPSSVTYIGVSAFDNVDGLTDVQYSSDGGAVSAQCFMNCDNLRTVTLTEYITSIERYAFGNCMSLSAITVPRSVTHINSTAFNGCDNLVIYCYTDSYAQQFAEEKGIEYVLIDAPMPTEPPTEAPTEAPTTQPTEPVTEEPTQPTSATEAPTEEPTLAPGSYILGDADGSGYVDIVDATFIQRIATNIDVPISREILMHADVDGDDDLTAIDATLIMRHLIRITTPYPIGEPVE